MPDSQLTLSLRRHRLTQNERGHNIWQEVVTAKPVPAAATALIICDVWDDHWSRGAVDRLNAMVGRMNEVICAARARGVQIIHAPSETMDFYAGTPARQRVLAAPSVDPPADRDVADPPLPIDSSDSSDTNEASWYKAWSRQHPAIEIDQAQDGISDSGREIYSLLRQRGIAQVLILGVHTNMCILRRSFAIKQMVRWGVEIALVRDLTDTMYNPAKAPYVSHDEGTQLVIGYIERFWCPTISSTELTTG